MKRTLLLLSCLVLPGCALWSRLMGPPHAPPEEASTFEFPFGLPPEGRLVIPGPAAVAVQLAMDDFRPWNIGPHPGATAREACLYQRESFDVTVAPGGEGLVFVRFSVRDGACDAGGPPIMDQGATYAVDIKSKRILAVQR